MINVFYLLEKPGVYINMVLSFWQILINLHSFNTIMFRRLPYETFDILTDEEVRQGLKTYSNWPTYPQVSCIGY